MPTKLPIAMLTSDQFLARVEAFLVAQKMSPTALGREALKDPAFVFELRRDQPRHRLHGEAPSRPRALGRLMTNTPCHHGLWAWRMVVTYRPTLTGAEQIAEMRRLIAWCAVGESDGEQTVRASATSAATLAPSAS